MNKYIILIVVFFSSMFQSQISMEYVVESQIDTYQLKLNVNIINNSKDYYILPLDISGFKGYYESEYCGVLDDRDYPYKFFAPTVMLKEENTKDYLFPGSSKGHVPEEEGAEKYLHDLQSLANRELKEIDEWEERYHFKTHEDALKNRYITKNFLILKPHEKYNYVITLDLGNIIRTNTSSSSLYDYYSLGFAKYDLSLHLCITNDSYNWFTKEQKKRLKKYKLFKGVIKSNSYLFKAYDK